MKKSSQAFLCCALALLLTPVPLQCLASASLPTVEAMVLFATNEPTPRNDELVAPFATDLHEVFGYNNYEVIGRKKRVMESSSEQWLVPSREFYLKLFGRPDKAFLRIYAELYQQKKLLLSLEAELVVDKPLFIRGPQWGKGQLIIVLVAR